MLQVYVLNRLLILDVMVSVILNGDGQAGYLIITFRDVTSKVKTQEARSAAQNLLNDIIEEMPIGFIAADVQFNILRLNAAACNLFGCERESMVGEPVTALISSETNDFKPESFWQKFVHDKSLNSLHEGGRLEGLRGGVRFPIKISVIRLAFGGFPLWCIMVLDITETQNALARAIESESTMRQMQKQEALGQLAGNIAHDFNNIMAIVMGYAEQISRREFSPEALSEMSTEITDAVHRGARLTAQILAYAKHQNLEVKPQDMHQLLLEGRPMIHAAVSARVRCFFDLSATRTSVAIDESQVMQVILNLAVNARDAMPNGGEFQIATTNRELDADFFLSRSIAPQVGDYLYMTVKDSGVGIPAENLHRVFDPYFSTKPRDKGTGLGLSVVYGIIKQHGGLIFCDSIPGKGTRFEIFLRLSEKPNERQAAKNREHISSTAARSRIVTILLVEDEIQLRNLLTLQLTESGFTVHSLGNGREAVEFVDAYEGTIDLIISDVLMPEINGLDMVNEISLLQPNARVIFISGYSEDLFSNCGKLGTHRLLLKPFSHDQLLAEITSALTLMTH